MKMYVGKKVEINFPKYVGKDGVVDFGTVVGIFVCVFKGPVNYYNGIPYNIPKENDFPIDYILIDPGHPFSMYKIPVINILSIKLLE